MSVRTVDLAPAALGLAVEPSPVVDGDVVGWRVRAAPHLHGPVGYLQGGLGAGLALAIVRHGDAVRAPATTVDIRLRAPTPLGTRLGAVVRRAEAGAYEVELRHDDTLLIEGSVELAGHAVTPAPADLASLKDVPPPAPIETHEFSQCWVCGDANPDGLHLLPAWAGDGRIVVPWIADDRFADKRGFVDPVVLCAVLDCPTGFANLHHVEALGLSAFLLASYRVTFRADLPAGTPVKCVGISDGADGRKMTSRSAIVDADGVVYAYAASLWIAVEQLPI